ncbi:MAG: alpha/beta hydrolase [Calditrichaeota bacterium]|nr:MAG: alpha/beta hydrolase [Calditrichota bacterium]
MRGLLYICLTVVLSLQVVWGKSPQAFQVTVAGKGPAMFLIPGATSSGDVWRETVEHFKRDYTVYTFTLPGYAGVPPLSSDSILVPVKNALKSYIRAHATENSVIIGHSIGGFLGMWMAAEVPDIVDRLVIVDAVPFLPALHNPSMTEEMARKAFAQYKDYYTHMDSATVYATQKMILQGMIRDEQARQRVLEQSVLSDRRTMGMTMYEIMSRDLRPLLNRITLPVLVITSWDENSDALSGLTRDKKLALYNQQYAGVSRLKLTCVDQARHFVMLDQPQVFWETVTQFLNASRITLK